MKVSVLLESRRAQWSELELLCQMLEHRRGRRADAAAIPRFAALYRAACADLALADAYQLPPETIQYLHRLVGNSHNRLYRSRVFDVGAWTHRLLVDVPRQLFADNALRLAFCLFWGGFLLSMLLASTQPGYVETVLDEEMVRQMQSMYSTSLSRTGQQNFQMTGFYVQHNASIGLQCFAFGLFFGVGGMFITLHNALTLGAVFGFMMNQPYRGNFFNFVTAHGPFELTAIVLSAAAGMRLGFSLIDTRGLTRGDSLLRAGRQTMPVACAALLLFVLAALIEGFISPSPVPYSYKATVAAFSAAALVFYFIVLGYPRDS
jgi:uncharacterized membrane protein SpoIIM required for sporulation